jgi:hypothetical protein
MRRWGLLLTEWGKTAWDLMRLWYNHGTYAWGRGPLVQIVWICSLGLLAPRGRTLLCTPLKVLSVLESIVCTTTLLCMVFGWTVSAVVQTLQLLPNKLGAAVARRIWLGQV